MCRPEAFIRRYVDVVQEALGLQVEVLHNGDYLRIRRGDLIFFLINTAPRDPEVLQLDLPVPSQPVSSSELRASATNAVNMSVKGARLFHRDDMTISHVSMVLAPADSLPDQWLLRSVKPRVLDMLVTAQCRYRDELELGGILAVTETDQPGPA